MPNYHLDEHVGDHRDKNTTQVAVHVQHTAACLAGTDLAVGL